MQQQFLSIETASELAQFLNLLFYQLEEIINNPFYKHHVIKKKRGGKRELFAPAKTLKRLQKRFNRCLQNYYADIKPDGIHGFTINSGSKEGYCNIVENAKPHVGKKHILNIDLKDFFPNISAHRVKQLFESPLFDYNEHIAAALTLLTTYRGRLPTGAPTSPIISNFICFQLDVALKTYCEVYNGLIYTRYADDLTFSSNSPISDQTLFEIREIIEKNNFRINEKKIRLKSFSQKQTVTGLVVNEKVNVERKFLKKVRAMLHDATANGIDSAAQRHFNLKDTPTDKQRLTFISRLEGYVNFIGQVKGKNNLVYLRFKEMLNKKSLYLQS